MFDGLKLTICVRFSFDGCVRIRMYMNTRVRVHIYAYTCVCDGVCMYGYECESVRLPSRFFCNKIGLSK